MLKLRALLLLLAISVAVYSAWRIRAPRGAFFGRMFALLLLAWIVELTGILTAVCRVSNVAVYNVYATIEYAVLLGMVQGMRPSWSRVLNVVLGIGVVSMACSAIMKGVGTYLAIEGLLVIGVLSSGVFLWVLVDLALANESPLGRVPAFWFFTGALLYFGGTIPILGAWRSMGSMDMHLSQLMYWIVVALAIIRYCLSAVACHVQHQLVRPPA